MATDAERLADLRRKPAVRERVPAYADNIIEIRAGIARLEPITKQGA